MRIPELSYTFEDDQYVHRQACLRVGGLSIRATAITTAGNIDRDNQDAFGFTAFDDHISAAVFDGAVSREASHYARELFEAADNHNPAAMLCAINQKLAAYDLDGGASTGTILGITRQGAIGLGHVSDSWAMAWLHDGTTRLLTTDQHERFDSRALETMSQVALDEGLDISVPKQHAQARQHPAVKQALSAMFNTVRNAPDGSGEGILNGDPFMTQYVQTLAQPLMADQVRAILLGSDGARLPYQTERDSAYRLKLFQLVAEQGVAETVGTIHRQESVYPPTIAHPRWSFHDDKTLIELSFL